MATGSSPAKMVEAILRYVQQRTATMTGDALTSLIAAQCQSCVLHLRSASISYDDAQAILALLSSEHCMFTTDQIAQVSSVVDQKLALTAPLSGARASHIGSQGAQQQTHNHFCHYFTNKMWAVITSHTHTCTTNWSSVRSILSMFYCCGILPSPPAETWSQLSRLPSMTIPA